MLNRGNVLLVWHQNSSTISGSDLYLDHIATLVGDDVYFKKSESGDKVPFWINSWEGLTHNFPTNIFFWEWRRLVRNNPLSPNLYYGPGKESSLKPARNYLGSMHNFLAYLPMQIASTPRLSKSHLVRCLGDYGLG